MKTSKILNFSAEAILFIAVLTTGDVNANAGITEGTKQAKKFEIDNAKKGEELRIKIIDTAEKLHDKKPQLISQIMESILLETIPIGTKFDDAESILRSAGFSVSPRSTLKIPQPGEFSDRTTAYMPAISKAGTILKVSENLHVFLFPKVLGRCDRVSKIEAFVDVPMP